MSTLKDYLRTKRENMNALATRKEDVRRDWVEALRRLMQQIDEWVEPLEEVGLRIEKESTSIHEEALGSYEVPARRLVFGETGVFVLPVARLIIGGDGRVDILGPNERWMLVYNEAEKTWSVVSETDRSHRGTFDEERFEEILKANL